MSAALAVAEPQIAALVPAYNEEHTIGNVVASAFSYGLSPVVVVDDGSSDQTRKNALNAGATVLSSPVNLGVGGALRIGFRYLARAEVPGAIQMDGDGQHLGSSIPAMRQALSSGADLVIGSRFASPAGMEIGTVRRGAQRLLASMLSKSMGVQLHDVTSGYRAFSQRTINLFGAHYPAEFLSDTVEALLLARDAGLTVVEQQVEMCERVAGVASQSSIMLPFVYARLMLVLGLHRFRPIEHRP
jgi:glycosyltransferase involved in cell wall biosynthesis